MKLVDSHVHLASDGLYEDAEEIIANAQAAGIVKMMVITLNPEEFQRAKQLKAKYHDLLDIAYGLFPSDLHEMTEADWNAFYAITQDEDVKAIGEIGLDYHWDKEHAQLQKEGLIRPVKQGQQLQKPPSGHSREAMQDTIAIIQTHLRGKGLMHCYSGSAESAKVLMKAGMDISFAGPITYKNARALVEVPPVVPLDHILVETDAPYLTPHPHRGKRNEPRYVTYTFEKICELKHCDSEALSEAVLANYKRLFG